MPKSVTSLAFVVNRVCRAVGGGAGGGRAGNINVENNDVVDLNAGNGDDFGVDLVLDLNVDDLNANIVILLRLLYISLFFFLLPV